MVSPMAAAGRRSSRRRRGGRVLDGAGSPDPSAGSPDLGAGSPDPGAGSPDLAAGATTAAVPLLLPSSRASVAGSSGGGGSGDRTRRRTGLRLRQRVASDRGFALPEPRRGASGRSSASANRPAEPRSPLLRCARPTIVPALRLCSLQSVPNPSPSCFARTLFKLQNGVF
jgi:hypothetical protein